MKATAHIAHVPYRNQGGEDQHVQSLIEIYRRNGVGYKLIPENRDPKSYGALEIAQSLKGGASPSALALSNSFFHLHNIFPLLGPRFLSDIVQLGRPIIWTIHNHRFYCTNGLAFRDGERCERCKSAPSLLAPLINNCNKSLPKSAYYSLALNTIRRNNLYQSINHFIAPSPYIADELTSYGIKLNRISILPNPVFDSTSSVPESEEKKKSGVLYAGRLSHEKGVSIIPDLARSSPSEFFEVYGDGPLSADLRRAGENLPNLRFFGAVPRSKVLERLRTAKATLLPSVCYEVCPTSAIESLALGVPVYLVPSPSTRWLVENYGAISVSDASSGSFAAALKQNSPNPLDSKQLLKVRNDFSSEEYGSRLMAILREVGLEI